MKYWKNYENCLQKHPYKLIQKITPNFGLPNPIEKQKQKYIASKIRQANTIFDWIIDKIPV